MDTPLKDLPQNILDIIFYGNDGDRIPMEYNSRAFSGFYHASYEGVAKNLMRRYNDTDSEMVKNEISKYMKEVPCSKCGGKRLKPEALAVTVNGKNIFELTEMSVAKLKEFMGGLSLTHTQHLIADRIVKEIFARLDFLINVGLDYLTLSRSAATLSGGESQRIRLATQIGSGLTGVLYILDEPSIGLHQKDNQRLLQSLKTCEIWAIRSSLSSMTRRPFAMRTTSWTSAWAQAYTAARSWRAARLTISLHKRTA